MMRGLPSSLADYRTPHTVLIRDVESLIATKPEILAEAATIGFRSPPDGPALVREWRYFIEILETHKINVIQLRNSPGLTLDALYVRDAVAMVPSRLIRCHMTKENRRQEVQSISSELEGAGFTVDDAISPPGRLEGGDVIWLADDVCAIGITYRTNLVGAKQFAKLLDASIRVIFVELPHFRGPKHILHLTSVMSVVSKQAVVADVGLLPAAFVAQLGKLAFRVIEVPECERNTLNSNILPIGPDELLVVAGNASTSAMLRSEGFRVVAMPADNLCILGDGGPTCLTRPIRFNAVDHGIASGESR
jgi:N-dimethylarginine dimethylaminohydrolase